MRSRIEERTPFPWAVKETLLKETGGKCAHCGILLDRYSNMTVDHFIPLNRGGTNDQVNLTMLCDGCNQEKSDMVLPSSWYPFLSPAKRREMAAAMKQYMKDTDYLSQDCLLPVDTFRIEVPVTAKRKACGGYRMIRMPAYIQGTRMQKEDSFCWLMEYKKHLQWRDACGVLTHPSEFTAPCYMLKKGDIEVAMVNPWMIHEWDAGLGNYRNEVLVDWFFSPSLPKRDYLPEMLACMTAGVETYISSSMSKNMDTACAVLFRTRCFMSDRFCGPVFDLLAEGHNDDINEFHADGSSLTARIREVSAIVLVGSRKACKELERKLDGENPDGMVAMGDAMDRNESLNRRLERNGGQ